MKRTLRIFANKLTKFTEKISQCSMEIVSIQLVLYTHRSPTDEICSSK
jgi:hypothetical protein